MMSQIADEDSHQELPESHHYKIFIKNFSKLKNILTGNLRNLIDHFVTERIIDLTDKETIDVDSLLLAIGSHLQSGVNSTFYKLVEVMKIYGSLAVAELGENIKFQLDGLPMDTAVTVDFTNYDDVEDMFVALVSALRNMLSEDKFKSLRRGLTLNKKIKKLPSSFTDQIRATEKLDDLVDVVVESPYCNWMNIRLLEQMAAASLQNNIHQLIGQYKNTVYSKRLQDVFQQITETEVPEDYCSKIKQKWDKEFEEVTLRDVIRHWERLEKIFDTEEPTLLLERIIKSSVQFFWLIPSELVCHARYSAFTNWHQLDDILYLEICDHVIKDYRYNFSIVNSSTATPYEVIDHFTDFLLVSLKHETLLPSMHSCGLLADHDLEVIATGPTGYHRNRLILNCVRYMDINGLFIFSKVLHETHPQVNIPLMDALHSTGFLPFRSFNAPLTGLPETPHPFNRYKLAQEKKDEAALKPRSRKRPSAQVESTAGKYFKPSVINKEFLQLVDQLNELMQFCDPEMIVEHCSTLMASDIHNITVFPTEYVNKLQNYNHTPSLLRILSSFWTWSDSSVLKVLLRSDSEALKLLDKFDVQTDPSQRLVSYPLPSPSPCLAPNDSSTHTVLAVKCAQQYYQCLLKHVFEVRTQMTKTFEITEHSLQLLATKSSSTILYWLIPKSVVALISAKTLEYSSVLYAAGILEVSIFPGARISTQAASLSGPLVFLSSTTLSESKLPVKLSSSAFKELMGLPEELHEVINDLLLEIEEKDALLLQYDRERQQLQAHIYDQRVYIQSIPADHSGITVDSGEELQSVKEKSSDHFRASEKVELKEGDIALEPNVWQGRSNIVSELEEDIEDLQEKLRERGLNPEMVPELEGNVKLPSYASASKNVDVFTFHDVVIHKELGSGTYGTKYQVSSDEMLMVGNVLYDQLLPSGEKLHKMIEQFKSDCFLAVKMHHPHVIEYFGMCNKAPYKFPMMLQEFAEENLESFLERTKNTLTFAHKLRLGLEMASGLEFLHVHLIVHKSLNASNVLIDKDGHAKISDFITPQLDNVQFSSQSNSVYIAPEIFRSNSYFSFESDIFSLGILSLYLFTMVTITAGKLQDTIEDVKYRPLKRLICSCISSNVMDRPNAGQVCRQIIEIQNCPTSVAYEALTSQNAIDFTDAIISGRYTIRWSDCKALDLPTWWAHAVTIGQKVYVCGGNSAGTQSEDVFVYHLLENTWRTLPQPGVYYAVPVSIKDKLTLVGGRDSTVFKFSAKLLTFDDSTQRWVKQFPDLLTARSRPGVIVCSHYLIVAGGKLKSKGLCSNDIEFLNLEEFPLRWKKSAVKLPTNMWDLTVFSCENYFWIVGYGDGRRRKFVHNILITDIVSSVPSSKKRYDWIALPETIHWKCTVLSGNGFLPIVLGGENRENAPSDAVCYYDSETHNWLESKVAFMRTPRAFPAVSMIGKSAVIAIGGCSDSKQEISEDYSVKSVEIGILEITH